LYFMSLHLNKNSPTTPTQIFARRTSSTITGIGIALIAAITLSLATPANAATPEITTAQTQLDDAQRALDTAKQEQQSAINNHTAATQNATTLKDQATQAGKIADEATRAYVRLLREGSASGTALVGEALTAGESKDLLNGLTMAGKTSDLISNNTSAGDRVAHYRNTATTLTQQAKEADSALNTIPLGDRQNAVAAAETEVSNKRNHLDFLQAQTRPTSRGKSHTPRN
jgi:hypothetical protein